MTKIIDQNSWKRKEYFDFFNNMDDPFWGVVTKVDMTACYQSCKANNSSFFLYSLHHILSTINAMDEFHYQLENGEIVWHDKINVSSTIGREDGSFGFSFFEYFPDIDIFIEHAQKEIKRVQSMSGLGLSDLEIRTDLIYFSALPWFSFSEMKHAKSFRTGNAVPRISTGKLSMNNKRYVMDISLDVHHGFMDGRHAGVFFDKLSGK